LLAPQLSTLVAAPAVAVLVVAAWAAWRALGGRLDRRAVPLLIAAGLVTALRLFLEIGLRTG
jgi:hypothetical protein